MSRLTYKSNQNSLQYGRTKGEEPVVIRNVIKENVSISIDRYKHPPSCSVLLQYVFIVQNLTRSYMSQVIPTGKNNGFGVLYALFTLSNWSHSQSQDTKKITII